MKNIAQITDISTSIGTTTFKIKLKGMRKPQQFDVYPIKEEDSKTVIMVQSDKRIALIHLDTGTGKISENHANGAYFHHLSIDTLQHFQLTTLDLQALKLHIFTTNSKEAGTTGFYTDNSGAADIL